MAFSSIIVDAPSIAVPDEFIEGSVQIVIPSPQGWIDRLRVVAIYENQPNGWELDPVTIIDEYTTFTDHIYNFAFMMRYCDIRIKAYTYYHSTMDNEWHDDKAVIHPITVGVPPQGNLLESQFEYYNVREADHWQGSPPNNIGQGQEIGIHVMYQNTSDHVQDMAAHVFIYNSSGALIAQKKPGAVAVASAGINDTILTTRNTSGLGPYTANIILYADGEEVDSQEDWPVATVVEQEITGEFVPNMFYYWNCPNKQWEQQVPQGIVALVIGIQSSARNTGTGPQQMAIHTTIFDPNHQAIKNHTSPVQTVTPPNFLSSGVDSSDLTVPGDYYAELELIADGQVVNTWSGVIASVTDISGGTCTNPGETKCVSGDLWVCGDDMSWHLLERNSPQCEEEEEGEFPWLWVGVGGAALLAAFLLMPRKKQT